MIQLEVTLHSKDEVKLIEVETFDAVALNDQLNDNSINTVLIGDSIFARIDIKGVERINEEIS